MKNCPHLHKLIESPPQGEYRPRLNATCKDCGEVFPDRYSSSFVPRLNSSGRIATFIPPRRVDTVERR